MLVSLLLGMTSHPFFGSLFGGGPITGPVSLPEKFKAKYFVPYMPHATPHHSSPPAPSGVPLCPDLTECARRQIEARLLLTQGTETPVSERMPVTPLCTLEIHGVEVLDHVIRTLAQQTKADLIILDPADMAEGTHGVCGAEMCRDLWSLFCSNDADQIPTEGRRWVQAITQMCLPGVHPSQGRIIYLRDFGTLRHALSASFLRTLHEAASEQPHTIVVAGIVPTSSGSTGSDSDSATWSTEREQFLREMRLRGDSFPEFLQSIYGTRRVFETEFESIEELLSAAFSSHYEGEESSNDSSWFSRLRAAFKKFWDDEGALNLTFTPVVRVGLSDDLPNNILDAAARSRRRRVIGANLRLLNVAMRQVGKRFELPPTEQDWNTLLEAPDMTPHAALCTKGYSKAQLEVIADHLPSEATASHLVDLLQLLENAENAFQRRISTIRRQRFDDVVEAVRADTSLTDNERELFSCVVDPATIRTGLKDVCLEESTQRTLEAIVRFQLSNPGSLGTGVLSSEISGGVLLYGPPGTGKTMLCRALAKEGGARMLHIRPSTIERSPAGMSEELVRAVFSLGRRLGPCIILFDEADAICSRPSERTADWQRKHTSEILQEIDGLLTADLNREKGILVVAATNRPQDLDDAIVRRLPRRILIDLPGRPDRERILRKYLENDAHDASAVGIVAAKTVHYSGSDLRHVVVAAALAAKQQSTSQPGHPGAQQPQPQPRITEAHFTQAVNEILPSAAANLDALEKLRAWGGRRRRRTGGLP